MLTEIVEDAAKEVARICEGPDAGWGIYATLLRHYIGLAWMGGYDEATAALPSAKEG